jgi:glycosyltransferase involved in cell wall biosynthesis
MIKKKILIISPGLPYPPIDGHKLKLYNLCTQLKNEFDLSIVILSNEIVTTECKLFLDKIFHNYKVFKYSKLIVLFNLLKTIFNKNIPYQVGYYDFPKVKKHLIKYYKDVDYVFFNLVRTTSYINIFKRDKIVLDMVDSIGLNYINSKNKTSSLLFKIIYSLESNRLLQHEINCVKKSKYSLFVNKKEAEYFSSHGKVIWLPNGVNKDLFKYKCVNKYPIVCFFGAMFYQPNIDAVIWFSKKVVPLLNTSIKFYIIGGRPSREVLKLQSDRIIVTNFIENPYDLIKHSLCSVAPMQTGGGIQNKILESMAIGQITLTNNMGATPISGSINYQNLIIANTPTEFATIINELYINPEKYDYIKKNAKEIVFKKYSWDNYGNTLINLLNS